MRTSTVSFADFGQSRSADETLTKTYSLLLSRNGYVHVTDVPSNFDHKGFLSRFGSFMMSPLGNVVDDVVPEPGMDDVYYGGNRQALFPHTEGYEYDGLPPKYLALWCVTPASGHGGRTTLFDAAPFLSALEVAEQSWLESTDFDWQASAGLRRLGKVRVARHRILERIDGETVLRFSYNNILSAGVAERPAETSLTGQFLERIRNAFEEGHVAISYREGDLLHWNNWRVLHAREAFVDPSRHLKRVQIAH